MLQRFKEIWRIFNEDGKFQRNGSQFDVLLSDNQSINIGSIDGYVLHKDTHRHVLLMFSATPSSWEYLFMPDSGTLEQFSGGDARQLYRSIQRFYLFPRIAESLFVTIICPMEESSSMKQQ